MSGQVGDGPLAVRPSIVKCAAVFAVLAVVAGGGESASAQLPCVPPLCTPAPPPPPPPPPAATTPTVPTTAVDPAPGTVPSAARSQVTALVDPAHTSYAADDELVPPLTSRWVRDLHANATEAVAGDGQVFVAIGKSVRAFDARTGRPRWTATGPTGALAYDAGRVFAARGQSLVGLSATDGRELWRREVSPYYGVDTVPVAAAGRVYFGTPDGSSRMIAMDAATGTILWTAGGAGTGNTPAVSNAMVFGSYACGLTLGWSRLDGSRTWNTTSNCSGGGGSTPTVYGGRLYVPENGGVYDAASGRRVGSTPKQNGVFAAGLAIHLENTQAERPRLRARRLSTGRSVWSRTLPDPTVGNTTYFLRSVAPVGVGSVVYMIHGGLLVGYDIATGRPVESGRLRINTGGSEIAAVVPIGDGGLLITGGRTLLAIQTALRPTRNGVAAAASTTDAEAGERITLQGRLGTALRGSRPRTIVEADIAPFDGRFRRVGSVRAAADGRFVKGLVLDRNARLRARVAGHRAAAGTVFVYPRVRIKLSGAGTQNFRVSYRVKAARSVDLSSRGVVVYLARPSKKVYVRLGRGPLHKVAAGRYTGSIVARRRQSVGTEDYVTLCVRRSRRLGLGRQDALTRGCGRTSVALGG